MPFRILPAEKAQLDDIVGAMSDVLQGADEFVWSRSGRSRQQARIHAVPDLGAGVLGGCVAPLLMAVDRTHA